MIFNLGERTNLLTTLFCDKHSDRRFDLESIKVKDQVSVDEVLALITTNKKTDGVEMTKTRFSLILIGTILLALSLFLSTKQAELVKQNDSAEERVAAVEDIDRGVVNPPIDSLDFGNHEIDQAQSDSSKALNPQSSMSGSTFNLEPSSVIYNSSATHKSRARYKDSRDQLQRLARQYDLRFLAEPEVVEDDEALALKRSRKYLERQLIDRTDDAELTTLARQVGVSEGLIERYEAQSRYLQNFGDLDPSPPSLGASSARKSVPSNGVGQVTSQALNQHSNQRSPSKQSSAALRVSHSQHQAQPTEQLQSITRSVASLRRSLIASTSHRLAELQIKRPGSDNY